MLRLILATVLVFAFGGEVFAEDAPPSPQAEPAKPPVSPGGLFVVRDGAPVELGRARFLEKVAQAAYIVIGEQHATPCDHEVQGAILTKLAEEGFSPVLGLEMVQLDMRAATEAVNRGEVPLDRLREALDWDARWGHTFEAYAPLFKAVYAHKIPIHPLNIPEKARRAYADKGPAGLAKEDRAYAPEKLILPTPEQTAQLRAFFDMHGRAVQQSSKRKQPKTTASFSRFLTVQSLWDTVMAESAVKLRRATGRPVVIAAGSAHAEKGAGIPLRLAALDPEAVVLSVMPRRTLELGKSRGDMGLGDVYFYCPPKAGARLGIVLSQKDGVLTVEELVPGLRAEAAGVKPGDRILATQFGPVRRLDDLHQAGMKARNEGKLVLTVDRAGESLDLTLDFTPKKP